MSTFCKLKPFISRPVWSGSKLAKLKGLDSPVGETWEVSTHEKGSSLLGDERLRDTKKLNYLVKFIDTADNLSIQVHPGDEYARVHENDSGKMECWLILEAQEKAGIYLGFREGVTEEQFFSSLENGKSIIEMLNFYEVKKGDFFVIPEGTVHAIGKGVTLCEVQQSSGITYRVWDWNRVGNDGKPRELHISKARDVLNFSKLHNDSLKRFFRKNLFSTKRLKLIEHRDFNVELLNFKEKQKIKITLKENQSIIVLNGDLKGEVGLNSYESGFALSECNLEFETQDNTSILIVSE